MTLTQLQQLLEKNALFYSEEFKRLFHGRGGLYEGLKHLTGDSIDTIVSVALYFEKSPVYKDLCIINYEKKESDRI